MFEAEFTSMGRENKLETLETFTTMTVSMIRYEDAGATEKGLKLEAMLDCPLQNKGTITLLS